MVAQKKQVNTIFCVFKFAPAATWTLIQFWGYVYAMCCPKIHHDVTESHTNFVFFFWITEKGFGIHQCPFGVGDEIRQILPGLQTDFEDFASGQG